MTPFHGLRLHIMPTALALGAVSVALLACHRAMPSAPLAAAPSLSPSAAPNSVATLSDADIRGAIDRHFRDESLLRREHVAVAVTQGIATLSGAVGNILAKERALAVAETIKGVRGVVDQVTVTPVHRSDDQLKSDVTEALRMDVATRPYKIGVVAKDGTVRLSGTAESWQEKNLFADIAKTVSGVVAVDNEITLHYAVERSEAEIAADVRHRLANDVWLDGNTLAVKVTGRSVLLSGVVGSLGQEMRASSDAWVTGVDGVDDSGVTVDFYAYNDQRHILSYPLRTDGEITEGVRDAFRFDPRLKTLVPHVVVRDGTVTLTGAVGSARARRAAEADAKDAVGVWTVRDDVVVEPPSKPTDADIERAAERVLAGDVFLPDGKTIHVSSEKGKVALKGTIGEVSERFDAVEDVETVPGVTGIDVDLVVARTPVDVKASIEERLFWDPMVERDRIDVAVGPDGVATMSGTLDSWSEVEAAADDANWGGATRVVNLLKLKNRPDAGAP
jgi:osmotically-inducible protein OsmY